MRNKRFPKYPDDADYTTNSPSYYDDLARKQKLIQLLAEKIWDYDDEIKEYFIRWEDNLENINEDVVEMMIQWLEDGTLEQIINHDVLGNKADKSFVDGEIDRLDQIDENLTTLINAEIERLDQLYKNHSYNPDDFEGETDAEKIQNCIDFALSDTNDHVSIKFYRDFDITGSTINIYKPMSPRRNLQFDGYGGGISKHDAGFMFNRSQEGNSYDVLFDNMNFRSTNGVGTTVFNGDKIMIVTDRGSNYWYVDKWVKAWSYVQSLKTHAQKIVGGTGSFIEIGAAYDCDFDAPLVESRQGNYFEQTRTGVNEEHRNLKGVYFRRCLIEGLTGYAIKLFRSEQVVIEHAYFEANEGGDIIIDPLGLTHSLVVENTMGHVPLGFGVKKPLITWGGEVQWSHTYNNRNNNGIVHDTSRVVGTSNIISEHDLSTGVPLPNIDPDNRLNYHPKGASDLINIETMNKTVLIPKNVITKVEFDFSEYIGLFDLVTVQSQGTSGSQNYTIHNHHRDTTDNKKYKVYITNHDETQEQMEIQLFLGHWKFTDR